MESNKTKLEEAEIKFVVARGWGWGAREVGEGGQKGQTSSHKVNQFRVCDVRTT